jgi:FlaA1/EpsC-like NDP-sugar epimerase
VLKLLPPRLAQVIVDLSVCVLALVGAYLIRFEFAIPKPYFKQMVLLLPYLALAHMLVNTGLGLYRIVWRYIGLREALLFLRAVAVVSLVLLAFRLFWPTDNHYLKVPLGIIILEGMFVFAGLTGVRFLRRIVWEQRQRGAHADRVRDRGAVRTLFVGAGEAGLAMAKEVIARPDLGMELVGFVDDDPAKQGMEVHGRRVLGKLSQIAAVLASTEARQIIITTATIPGKVILELMEHSRPAVDVRIVPSLYRLLGSKASLGMLREVRIEDLLSRAPVPPSMSLEDLRGNYQGKRVMVTGAGGSIGSELCRQIAMLDVAEVILVERDENNLFQIEHELRATGVKALRPFLVDICDRAVLEEVFRSHRPQVIFHAAAYKHVPMMERFPHAAVANNVFGTRTLTQLADRYEVEMFVMISTDKAVHPTSVMGASKRVAELVVQHAADRSPSRFSCVRFGNVLGSRGSVVGIFQDQIAKGGPLTVTHADARRYFMTIPEAVNLVLQAATLGDRGEVFLLDMGEPVKIIDLARQMIRLSGLSEEDVGIEVVGMRPGEKLFEELSTAGEDIEPTRLRKIFQCQPSEVDDEDLTRVLDRLSALAARKDGAGIREAIAEIGIGYADPAGPPSDAPPPVRPLKLPRAAAVH